MDAVTPQATPAQMGFLNAAHFAPYLVAALAIGTIRQPEPAPVLTLHGLPAPLREAPALSASD